MDVKNAYCLNGNFDSELLYVNTFGKIPNKYVFNCADSKERDSSSVQFEKIKDLFKKVLYVRQYTQVDEEEPSEVEKIEEPSNTHILDVLRRERGAYFTAAVDDKVIFVKYDSVTIYYDNQSLDEIASLAEKIFNSFPIKEDEDKSAKISLIKVYQGDYYTQDKDIKPTIIDIDENYNDDFKPVYEDTVKFLNERSSGLVLFWGTPGTGNFYKNNLYN